jgi:SAM-dependent methyltransferase
VVASCAVNPTLPAKSRRFFVLGCGVFCLTSSVLSTQLLEMRLLSFMLWHHLAYMVISMVLLGLGASGAVTAAKSEWFLPRHASVASTCAALAGLTTLAAFAITTRIELDTFELTGGRILTLLFYYGLLVVPYFFAGVSLSLVFAVGVERIGTLYGIDLLGSAAGCYLFYILIRPLGAPRALMVACALSAAAGVLLSFGMGGSGAPKPIIALASVGMILVSIPFADDIVAATPAPTKSLAVKMGDMYPGAHIVSTTWTPISRIDVLEADVSTDDFLHQKVPGNIMKMMTADGDANTWAFRHPDVRRPLPPVDPSEYSTYHEAFLVKPTPPKDVLIIGPGGGNEVYVAYQMGASSITAVELNPAMLNVTLEMFAAFTGHLYETPKARAVVGEGRSYVRSHGEDYDLIQMSGVDTWAGLSSGAYVLSENFLYTVEAIQEYYRHLKPDGILSVGRFTLDPPRESLRLVSIAFEALKELHVEHPEQQIIAASWGNPFLGRLLVKRSGFTPDEVKRHADGVARAGEGGTVYYAPDMVRDNPYSKLVLAYVAGTENNFFRDYQYDVTPVYDDKPFFFEYYKWSRILHDMKHAGEGGQIGANRPVGLMVLGGLLAQVSVLVLAFIYLPLSVFKRAGTRIPRWRNIVLYFSCLGFGYMFVEIGLMQRFVLFLAHPAYSIPVVLGTLLLSSGAGSLMAPRLPWPAPQRMRIVLLSLAGLLALLLVVLHPAFDAALGLAFGVRVAISMAMLAPVGFVMGMPFPLGVSAVSDLGAKVVPWAWGINGGTSVLGSVLAIVVAMGTGFTWVLVLSAAIYLVAFFAIRPVVLARPAGSPAGA